MITEDQLKNSGWAFREKCPFSGEPYWFKDEQYDEDFDRMSEIFMYYPNRSEVRYSSCQYSTITKPAKDIKYLNNFYEVLK